MDDGERSKESRSDEPRPKESGSDEPRPTETRSDEGGERRDEQQGASPTRFSPLQGNELWVGSGRREGGQMGPGGEGRMGPGEGGRMSPGGEGLQDGKDYPGRSEVRGFRGGNSNGRRDDRGSGGGGDGGRRDDRGYRGRGGGGRRDDGRYGTDDSGREDEDGGTGRHPAPPEHVDREIVIPGDRLDAGRFKSGPGTYQDGDGVFAACLGIRSVRGDQVSVIPLSGKYMPRVGDIVVGKVMEMTPSAWVIDLNSPYVAPLPGSETPWTVEFGETSKYMSIGDTVIVQIRDVNEMKRVGVTMIGPDLRKVVGGQTIDVDAAKVPRLIGRGGSMIGLLKRLTRCSILVGQNGRVWLDGTVEDVTVAMAAIRMIELNAHKLGVTDAVAAFIQGMRSEIEAKRARREKGRDAKEEEAIMKDRVQRSEELKKEEEE